jgi:hypothetical protein
MKQSRSTSLIKSIISTAVGFSISLAAQVTILPLLGVTVSLHQNITFAIIMTVISILRGYALERVFEFFGMRVKMSAFAHAVLAERMRQIDVEGWDHGHDDMHAYGELATAGAAYAKQAACHIDDHAHVLQQPKYYQPNFWPWSAEWWKPTGFRRDLVKACALILAEGEKFDRIGRRRAVPTIFTPPTCGNR